MEDTVLLARIDERLRALDDKLGSILDQVNKINGRVSDHGEQITEINKWKHEEIGFSRGSWKTASVIGALIGAIISFLGSLFLFK